MALIDAEKGPNTFPELRDSLIQKEIL